MLAHAVKLRLGAVGAVIGGPPVAIFFTSTPQSHFVRQLPPYTLSSLASHRHKQANYLRFLCDARCDDKFCVTRRADVLPLTQSCPRLRGKWHGVAMTKGERLEAAKLFYCSPSDNPPKLSPGWNKVALLTFVRNSPCSCPFSVSLHPPQAALNSKPRKRWSIIVRFISLHIKPALKGEVANVVSRRGYKAAYSSLFITTPQSNLRFASSPFGEPFEERISPHASARRVAQKFIATPCATQKA